MNEKLNSKHQIPFSSENHDDYLKNDHLLHQAAYNSNSSSSEPSLLDKTCPPKPMKIMMITLRTDLGGGPKHLLDLIRALNSNEKTQKNEYFLAAPIEEPFGPSLKNEFKNHFLLPHRSFNLKAFIQLVYFLKKYKIDIIHSHGRGAGLYSRLLFLLGWKVVHTFHGIHQSQSLLGKIKLGLDKLLTPFCNYYILCSLDEKNSAQKENLLGHVPWEIILNGINIGIFSPARNSQSSTTSDNNSPTSQIEFSSQRPLRMGVMARSDYQKGLDLLFSNCLELKKRNFPFVFYIAGSSKEEVKVPEALTHNIQFLGPLKNPQDFFDKIDIYVSHSRWEGLPLSVLETMDAQIPCLLSEVVGHFYFIENKSALGFKNDSFSDFYEKIQNLTSNKDLSKSLVNNAIQLLMKNHDQEKVPLLFLQVYQSVLK